MTVYFWVSVWVAAYMVVQIHRDPANSCAVRKSAMPWYGWVLGVLVIIYHFGAAMLAMWVVGGIIGLKWVE